MKKTVALLLAFAMLFSLCSCTKQSVSSPVPTSAPAESASESTMQPAPSVDEIQQEAEIQRAIDSGLVPKELQGDFDRTTTFAQYSEMLTALISLWDESRLPQWKEIIAAAAASHEEMRREDGILAISYAMVLMGITSGDGYRLANSNARGSLIPQEELDKQGSELSGDYPLFPDWDTVVYEQLNSSYMWGGMMMCLNIASNVSRKAIFPYDLATHSMHLQRPLTRREAILSVLRLAETDPTILEPAGQYVSIYETGAYDPSIITQELLAKPSALPEVTQAKTPNWKGAGIWQFKKDAKEYRDFEESAVQFLAENGMNFTTLFLDFSTLRFPFDNDDKTLVNQRELKELDQMLAWCIKHDVHLQLYMGAMSENDMMPGEKKFGELTDAQWNLLTDYWVMLTKRYTGIPSRYLSFSLLHETYPSALVFDPRAKYAADAFDAELTHVRALVESIRVADSGRVLSVFLPTYWSMEDWVEDIASLGVSIGIADYYPFWVSTTFWDDLLANPYIVQPDWPIPFFPIARIAYGEVPLTISGAVGGSTLGLHIAHANNQPEITVYADGKQIESFKLKGKDNPDDRFSYAYASGDTLYSAKIPVNTKEVTVTVTHGIAWIDLLRLEGGGHVVTMRPHDAEGEMEFSDPLPLVIKADGTYTNSEDRFVTGEMIYEQRILPYQRIAEKYGVGFMLAAFEIHGCGVGNWDFGMIGDYYNDYLAVLNAHGIAWSKGEMCSGTPSNGLISYDDQYEYIGCKLEQILYRYEDGRVESFRVNRDMADIFREYGEQ